MSTTGKPQAPAGIFKKLGVLHELRGQGELCNACVTTDDGGRFPVHVEVLVARSPYFRRVAEAARDQGPWSSVHIPAVGRQEASEVLDFMYTGQLRLGLDNVQGVARAAELLEMQDAAELCREFLASVLDCDNCVGIYAFARHRGHPTLAARAEEYIVRHFQEVYQSCAQLFDLSADDLRSIVGSDLLDVQSEEHVFWAILRWLEKDPGGRAPSLPALLRCIRFGFLSHQFFSENVLSCEQLAGGGNDEVQAVLLQASEVHAFMQEGDPPSLVDPRHPFLRPRVPGEVLFAVGGWSTGSATNVVETYDVNCRRWFLSLFTDAFPRAYHGMLWHEGHVWVIGGFDGNQCFNSVRRFDPASRAWEEKACMFVQRCYVSVAALGPHIYAMGGYDGHRRSRSVERYDPRANQWTRVASMSQVRSDACADALNGKVYIAGGFNGSQVLNSAECYDPETDQWSNLPTMISPRSGVKLVAYQNYLYAIGGFNGTNRLGTVERYDVKGRRWMNVASMNSQRSNFAAAVLGGRLYVMGGFNGLSTVATAECYDHHGNRWSTVTDLNLNRSALAACTVSRIPNAVDYTFLGNVH